MTVPASPFTSAVDRLVRQVGHWTPSRWTASGAATGVHQLIQFLADLAADAEDRPSRPVPRLDNDLLLADQLRVVAADLAMARPPEAILAAAAAAVESTARQLPASRAFLR